MKKSMLLMLILTLIAGTGCKKDFLKETPLDFLSSANAFQTAADFDASTNNLYRLLRTELYTRDENLPWEYQYRTDLALNVPTGNPPNLVGEYNPVGSFTGGHWNAWYKIVAEANTIIGRIPKSQLSDNDKKLFEARARFFRAFAYRSLAYLFGGVPLELEEVIEPKTNYVRASRKEVYAQVIADLVFSAANLPGITAVRDGELSNLAAQHLLSEVYIADGQYQKAVDAATIVIDDPATDLMTARFGTRRTETPGDVYWDLFRRGNQNRKAAGNKEGILVIQIETDVPGGDGSSTPTSFPFPGLYTLERVHVPIVRDVRLRSSATDPNATRAAFNWPAADYSSGGRGVGFMAPSMYFVHNAYQYQGTGTTSDFVNDIRNANHNFVRKFKVTAAGNPLYPVGTEIDFHNLPPGTRGFNGALLVSGDTYNRALYPYQTKATEPFLPPPNLLDPAKAFPFQLKGVAAGTYRDEYLFRLAETYLLRAEAYLGLGSTGPAAADINVVRARSNASPVAAGSVDIDLILDERMREFGMEEKRMFTLMRMGKWYDRVKKCNPLYAPSASPTYNLWPIPFSEIERNRDAKLEQNPGYPN